MAVYNPSGGAGLPAPSAPKAPSPLQNVVNGILGGNPSGTVGQVPAGSRPGVTVPQYTLGNPATPGGNVNATPIPTPGAVTSGNDITPGNNITPGRAPGSIPPSHPGGAGRPPLPDPRDSTYYGNVAANTFKTNSQLNATELNSAENSQALQAALAQLRYAQPRAQLGLEQHANANNSLYSSVYGQNQGNLAYQYMGKEGGVEQKYGNAIMQDALKAAGLRAGEPLYDAQQYSDAATRAAILASKNKALGQQPAFPTGKVPGMGGRGRGRGPASNPRNGRSGGRVTKPTRPAGHPNSRNLFGKGNSSSGGAGL